MTIASLTTEVTNLIEIYENFENNLEARLAVIANNNAQHNIYIDSINGNDLNDGSILRPIQSFNGLISIVTNKTYGLLQIFLKGDQIFQLRDIIHLRADTLSILVWGEFGDYTLNPTIVQSSHIIDVPNNTYNASTVSIKSLSKITNSIGNIIIQDVDLKTAIRGGIVWPSQSNSIIFDNPMFRCSYGNFTSIIVSNSQSECINLFLEDGVLFFGSQISLYMSNCNINSSTRSERDVIAGLVPIIKGRLKELDYNNITLSGPFIHIAPSSLFKGSLLIIPASNLVPDISTGNTITTRSNINLSVSNSVARPIIISPTDNNNLLSLSTTIVSSAFATNYGVDTHLNSTWQLATDSNFTNIIQNSTNSTVNKTSWAVSGLSVSTSYYIRVKHIGTIFGESNWSSTFILTTATPTVLKPSITYPTNAAVGLTSSVTFTSSDFGISYTTDTHLSSSWELALDADFNNVVQNISQDTENLLFWNVNGLSIHTIYYVRVKYIGTVFGDSDWSEPIRFTTLTPTISKPSIIYPTDDATGIPSALTVTSSPFNISDGTDSHINSSWQLSNDVDFENIIQSIDYSNSNKTSWDISGLSINTTYYVRVRYTGAIIGDSEWSDGVSFGIITPVVSTPLIINPVNGSSGIESSITITSSSFAINYGTETHLNSTWELATDSAFTNIFDETIDDSTNKISWSVTGLTPGTLFYVRVKYAGTNGISSEWSTASSFVTIVSTMIRTPTITSPINGVVGQPTSLTITCSEFHVDYGTDTYVSTSWQISTDIGFSTLVKQSMNDTINVDSWDITGLSSNSNYYIRVRHEGENLGESRWSPIISFTTRTIPSTEISKFVPTDTQANMYFGSRVATNSNGTIFAITTPYDTYSGTNDVGSVYIYKSVSNNSYTKEAKILAPVLVVNGQLGHSVALSADGNTLLVGANNQFTATGRAYVFTRLGTTWSLEHTMMASDSTTYAYFGQDVALSADGNIALVSSQCRRNNGISGAGGVYVFIRSGTVWTQQTIIAASQPTASVDAYFGCAIAMSDDGNTIVIGAYNTAYGSYRTAGRAYVFTRNGDSWDQRVILRPDAISAQAYGYFGAAVAISGDGSTIVIAAAGTNNNAGLVFVFTGSGDTWDQVAKLLPNDIAVNDHFGQSVSINTQGNTILVSSVWDTNEKGVKAGAAYVYELTSSSPITWTQKSKLIPSDGRANNTFGNDVSLSSDGQTAIIGENAYNVNGLTQSGAAYIFK